MNHTFLAKLYGFARFKLSKVSVRKTSHQIKGKTSEDYTHEAIEAVMEGRRTIPESVVDAETALKFMLGVISSIISNDLTSKEIRSSAIAIEDAYQVSSSSDTLGELILDEETEEQEDIIEELREKLKGKSNALKCLDAYLDTDLEEAGGQINKVLASKTSLSLNEVVAAKKQMLRALEALKESKK